MLIRREPSSEVEVRTAGLGLSRVLWQDVTKAGRRGKSWRMDLN